MDFPLPIRSFSSTVDFSTPLFVDTNIVYKLDETKFPGLQEGPPALIVDPNISLNFSCDLSASPEWEYDDLYNLIDSLDVDDTVFSSVEPTVNILDLPDSRLELPKHQMSAYEQCPSFICVSSPGILNLSQLDLINEGCPNSSSLNSQTSSNANHSYGAIQSQKYETYAHNPSCRFTRKRNMSSALRDDVTNSIEKEEQIGSKRRKLDLHEFCITINSIYPIDKRFDNVLPNDFLSQQSVYSEIEQTSVFNFCGSPRRFSDRQW